MAGSALAGTLALVGAACGDDDDSADEAAATTEAGAGEDTTSGMSDAGEGEASASEPDTVVDVAASDESFSTLVTAVDAAGLAGTLSGDGPFTVFAPVNDAVAALPAGTVDASEAVPLEMAAGDGVFFAGTTWHYSAPNASGDRRLGGQHWRVRVCAVPTPVSSESPSRGETAPQTGEVAPGR